MRNLAGNGDGNNYVIRWKTVLVLLLLVCALGLLYTSVTLFTPPAEGDLLPANKIQAAPDFQLPDAKTGELVTLSHLTRSGPVVIMFWATWCGPCRAELPHAQAISARYAGRVAFYGINSNDAPEQINAFERDFHLTLPMLSDLQDKAANAYGASHIPLMVIVDRHNKVRGAAMGFDPDIDKNLPAALDTILGDG